MTTIPKRNFIIPVSIKDALERLTRQRDETTGVLIYEAHEDPQVGLLCPVFYFYKTGEGTPGQVTADRTKLEKVNNFLRGNGNYAPIVWHSHTQETIRRFGNYFARNFSEGDIRVIEENLARDPLYVAMLSTPEKHLLSRGDLSLSFTDNFEGFREGYERVNRHF